MNKFFAGLSVGIVVGAASLILGVMVASAYGVKTTLTVLEPVGVTASVRCNNTNYDYSAYCQSPVDHNSFRMIDVATFEGQLLSGAEFRQYPITSTLSKFEMQDAFWYIDRSGRFFAESDIQALSIHLTRN